MIDLNKIYASKVFSNYGNSPEYIATEAMREAIKQALELAANEAKLVRFNDWNPGAAYDTENNGQLCISSNWGGEYIKVNKKSITDVFNKVV